VHQATIASRSDRLAQRRVAGRDRVASEAVERLDQRIAHQCGHRVLWLADRQRDVGELCRGRCVAQQRTQALERVRVQAIEVGIHGCSGWVCYWTIGRWTPATSCTHLNSV
jgi:hypothetical protein